MNIERHTHPILTCEAAMALETKLLGGDEKKEWAAMKRAGRGLGRSLLEDFEEYAPLPVSPRILILAGKGHNAGDAVLAADEILAERARARINVVFVFGDKSLKPLLRRALEGLLKRGNGNIDVSAWREDSMGRIQGLDWDICIDGILGMQFRPPLRSPGDAVIEWINESEKIGIRAAVDLPSGVGDESGKQCFRADFTYATGIAKAPLFEPGNARAVGRIRYVDIGFFDDSGEMGRESRVLLPSVLNRLKRLREPQTDKRSYGHLYAVGGSRSMPGAIQMAVRAALKSGVGLLTAFVPESVAATFAGVLPEAMWVPFPEAPEGGLALEGYDFLRERLDRATALVIGPGMGREPETSALISKIVREISLPVVLDADALLPEVMEAVKERPTGAGAVVVTPHLGEFNRLLSKSGEVIAEEVLRQFCNEFNFVTILKGPTTRISDGSRIFYNCFGGPILARGGSGDILSGLTGSLLARPGADPLLSACQSVALHGRAADLLGRARGQMAVSTTDLLDFLAPAVRNV